MRGRRRWDKLTLTTPMKPGDYGEAVGGGWIVCNPRGQVALITKSTHTVDVHIEGSITISPSMIFKGGWSGFLEEGIWR